MIERTIFANDQDDVLDRRAGGFTAICLLRGLAGLRAAQPEGRSDMHASARPAQKAVKGFFCNQNDILPPQPDAAATTS